MSPKQEKFRLLADLIELAKADEHISEEEVKFLTSIAIQMEITEEEFNGIVNGELKGELPKTDADRIIQFHRLVLMMNIDLKVANEEISKIKDLGIKMGLNPIATNEVLRVMPFYPNNLVPTKKLIKIFRRSQN